MIPLNDVAIAFSRRVGPHVTLDVTVRVEDQFAWLDEALTVDRLLHHFRDLRVEQIRKFELASISVLHFVLYDVGDAHPVHWLLDGDGSLLASRFLDLELPCTCPPRLST